MEQSPFHKEVKEKPLGKELKARLPIQAREELETYFEKHYGDVSKGVRDVLMNFLNNLCQERKYFRNLHAIMLLPDTLDPDELNEKAKVIGFVDVEDNFSCPALFLGGASYRTRLKLIHTLEEFNESNYAFLGLEKLDKSVLFGVSKDMQDDFESVKTRLSELYQDIDIDKSLFIMFNINNYLDIEDKGQFHSKSSTYLHEGALILLKSFDENVCARLKWSYAQETFSLDIEFYHMSHFNMYMHRDLLDNGFKLEDLTFGETFSREEALKRKIKSYDSQIKNITSRREKACKQLKELQENS